MSLQLVVNLLGQVTLFLLFYSACPGLWKDRRAGRLTTDPIPFPIAWLNTLLWVVYGVVINDYWIFAGNFIGLGATTFNTVTVLRLCRDSGTTRLLEAIVICGVILFVTIMASTTSPMFIVDATVRRSIIATACTAIILVMFASPTLGAITAFRSSDASKVNLPLCLAQLVNGILWTAYGLSQGDLFVVGPNSFGSLLAIVNLLAKLLFRGHPSAALGTASVKEIKPRAFFQHGGEVLVRSVGGYVQIAEQDVERAGLGGMSSNEVPASVQSNSSEGSVLRVVPLAQQSSSSTNSGLRIALQSSDGRFLCVQSRPPSVRGSTFQPSPFQVVAVHRAEAGPDGEFIPVHGNALEIDPIVDIRNEVKKNKKTGNVALHTYPEENVAFWNPLHRVFVRANESGDLDCSPEFHSAPSGAVVIPAGWDWERFTLHPAPSSEGSGLRCRPAAIGKSWKSAGMAAAMAA